MKHRFIWLLGAWLWVAGCVPTGTAGSSSGDNRSESVGDNRSESMAADDFAAGGAIASMTDTGDNSDDCDGIRDGAGRCYPTCMNDDDCIVMTDSCQSTPLMNGNEVNICRPALGVADASDDGMSCDGVMDASGRCYAFCRRDNDCGGADETCESAMLSDGTTVDICRPTFAASAPAGPDGQDMAPAENTSDSDEGAAATEPADASGAAMNGPGEPDGAEPSTPDDEDTSGDDSAQDDSSSAMADPAANDNVPAGNNNGVDNGSTPSNFGRNTDPNAATSVQACSAWLECVDSCPQAQGPNDAVAQQCFQQCTNGNPRGAQVYRTWVECARNNQCINQITNMIDQDCLFDACLPEVEACFGAIARPNGEGSCSDFVGCVNNCPQGDQNCRDNCITATAERSFAQYESVITCLQDNMCWGADDMLSDDCFDLHCADLWDECIVDGRVFGNGTCADIHGCFWGCDVMDNVCQEACLETGTRAAWTAFREYLVCAGDAMCQDAPGCDAACGAERMACFEAGE